MSDLKKQAKKYIESINILNSNLNSNVMLLHSLAEIKFDTIVTSIEDSIEKDVTNHPEDIKKVNDLFKKVE